MYISFILPCRNEEKTIKKCILQLKKTFRDNKIAGEIIVSDSSEDNSPRIAKENNVLLVKHNEKGYGIAIMKGFKISKGDLIVIGDADGTYDFSALPSLISAAAGADMVIGSRLKGNIAKGAMPWHHRYIGNPFLSGLLNLLFHTKISDAHSGFRLIRRDAFEKLGLKTTGMEFASEMIIKAAKHGMRIAEVPTNYYPRIGESKLSSFSDGWRHLRFMLMFSPTYLFFIPGIILMLSGIITTFFNDGFFGPLSAIMGYQLINLGLYSRIYSIHTGFEKEDKLISFIASKFPLERGILLSMLLFIAGAISFRFRPLFALTLAIICFQTFFSVFFISMMLVEKSEN